MLRPTGAALGVASAAGCAPCGRLPAVNNVPRCARCRFAAFYTFLCKNKSVLLQLTIFGNKAFSLYFLLNSRKICDCSTIEKNTVVASRDNSPAAYTFLRCKPILSVPQPNEMAIWYLRQPNRLVFKTNIQTHCFIRLVNDNLIFVHTNPFIPNVALAIMIQMRLSFFVPLRANNAPLAKQGVR